MHQETRGNDAFATIAAQKVNYRDQSLIKPAPVELPDTFLPLDKVVTERNPLPGKKIASAQDLDEELQSQRVLFQNFLKNLAPKIKPTRKTVFLETFDWRIGSIEDKQDFFSVMSGRGSWERVSIPHYGEPLGKATTYYRTQFTITKEDLNHGSAFICFKGVDYKANVFINNAYVGSHEGFFAPFEFDFTDLAIQGENTLVVQVDNDFICGSNAPWGDSRSGDKIYAATGLGYDDPELGWHHCPPGMGIYQDVFVQFRPRVFVSDVFVRPAPEEGKAELWIECSNCDTFPSETKLSISIFGRNFESRVIDKQIYEPSVIHECGAGDDLQIARAKAKGIYQKPAPLKTGPGVNLYRVTVEFDEFRWWSPQTPWLYQAQVHLLDSGDSISDSFECHFGMRTFSMDEEGEPKGSLFLNGSPIRLRGANTMGHEQLCVADKNWDQLRDDILLAKICNMNFLRLTQRPVQPEVYDYCDMLGMMTQTDLPTFAVLRRNQYSEALKQVIEMERLVRNHPCNILVSYINEPVINSGNHPHRNLNRKELEDFFDSATRAIKHLNPDRVVKPCDGDYDPPSPGIQDRHCYCTWYNGQGLDYGELYRGYWQPTKPNWHYGCGEFGAEGLECYELMQKSYPSAWLPTHKEDSASWSPNQIKFSQTGQFHYFFFETPESIEEWINESQEYQARSVKTMTECFRRNNNMITFAIHLFIDAFPSGWMKTIMDCERRPKKAFFSYRDALTPLLLSIRSDRNKFFSGEEAKIEIWACNDLPEKLKDATLGYQVTRGDETIASGTCPIEIDSNTSKFQGYLQFKCPEFETRETLQVSTFIVEEGNTAITDNNLIIEVIPKQKIVSSSPISLLGSEEGTAAQLIEQLDLINTPESDVLLMVGASEYQATKDQILERVASGAKLIVLELDPGHYTFGKHHVEVKQSGFNSLHFASRRTNHPLTNGFEPRDFEHWYNPILDRISPFLHNTFTCDTADPILLSGNTNTNGEWDSALAAAELKHGKGSIIISQIELLNRLEANPTAYIYAQSLLVE